MLVCEFYRPDAGAAADVEDRVDGGGEGRAEEFAVEREAEGLVLEV